MWCVAGLTTKGCQLVGGNAQVGASALSCVLHCMPPAVSLPVHNSLTVEANNAWRTRVKSATLSYLVINCYIVVFSVF